MKIIAKTNILYNSILYKPGQEIPSANPEMIKAWLDADTVYIPEEPETTEPKEQTAPEEPKATEPKEQTAPEEPKATEPEEQTAPEEPKAFKTEKAMLKLKTEAELNKMPNKKSIMEYAKSIGISNLSEDLTKTIMIEKVLEHIKEMS